MKKVLALVLVFAFLTVFASAVCADGTKFSSAFELYSSWNGNYPDYVCGVWLSEDDGAIVFGVLEGSPGDVAKNVILSQVEDETSVKFETVKYTAAELKTVMSELEVYVGKNIGIKSTYFDVKRNRIEILVLAERVNDRTTQSIVATLKEKYGDKVNITYEGDMFKQTIIAVGDGNNSNDNAGIMSTRYLIILVSAIIALLASGYMIIIKKRGQLVSSIEANKRNAEKSTVDVTSETAEGDAASQEDSAEADEVEETETDEENK